MGIKLIILLALLVGVLYCLHLLVKDYQALTGPRLLRFLFKRDLNFRNETKPHVRWKKIYLHDPIHCARVFYCGIGAGGANEDMRKGFTYMLSLEPQAEDQTSQQIYLNAYNHGRFDKGNFEHCRKIYPMCPFSAPLLLNLVQYMLSTPGF